MQRTEPESYRNAVCLYNEYNERKVGTKKQSIRKREYKLHLKTNDDDELPSHGISRSPGGCECNEEAIADHAHYIEKFKDPKPHSWNQTIEDLKERTEYLTLKEMIPTYILSNAADRTSVPPDHPLGIHAYVNSIDQHSNQRGKGEGGGKQL